MGYFTNYYHDSALQNYFESKYEDVSEPLKEYQVGYNGSLIQVSSSDSLLGVQKNGKWGWVDHNDKFQIPALYDSGFVTCYNGIIILEKNGSWGGLYRNSGSAAFSFRYNYLGHCFEDTYCAHNSSDKCALVKPGDRMLTGFDYIGFSKYHSDNITEFVKSGFFGQTKGRIDLRTGREL